jgi:hypothetical protein
MQIVQIAVQYFNFHFSLLQDKMSIVETVFQNIDDSYPMYSVEKMVINRKFTWKTFTDNFTEPGYRKKSHISSARFSYEN